MIGDDHIDAFLDTLKNATYFPHLKRVVIKASSLGGLLWYLVSLNSKSKEHIRKRLLDSTFQPIETIVMWFLFLFFLGKSYVQQDWSSRWSDHWTLLCSLYLHSNRDSLDANLESVARFVNCMNRNSRKWEMKCHGRCLCIMLPVHPLFASRL